MCNAKLHTTNLTLSITAVTSLPQYNSLLYSSQPLTPNLHFVIQFMLKSYCLKQNFLGLYMEWFCQPLHSDSSDLIKNIKLFADNSFISVSYISPYFNNYAHTHTNIYICIYTYRYMCAICRCNHITLQLQFIELSRKIREFPLCAVFDRGRMIKKKENPTMDLRHRSCVTVPRNITNSVSRKNWVPKETIHYPDRNNFSNIRNTGCKMKRYILPIKVKKLILPIKVHNFFCTKQKET